MRGYLDIVSVAARGSTGLYPRRESDDRGGSRSSGAGVQETGCGTPGHIGMVIFDAVGGQRVSIDANGSSTTVPWYSSNMRLYGPDGTVLEDAGTSLYLDAVVLQHTGTYMIFVTDGATGQFSLTLYDVPADINVPIIPINDGGQSVTVSTTVPGQNAQLTFTGTAGERIFLDYPNPSGGWSDIRIIAPDGSIVAHPYSADCVYASNFIDTLTLAQTGTYTIFLNPLGDVLVTFTFYLYDVPADTSGPVQANGQSASLTTTVPGQNARFTFTGTAGQKVSMSWQGNNGVIFLLNPDGSTLAAPSVPGGFAFMDTQTLPTSGLYTILWDFSGNVTGSIQVTLYTVVDITDTISFGQTKSETITTPGQRAILSFSGTQGQRVSAYKSANFFCQAHIRKPDGSLLAETTLSGSFIDVQTLPVTGTYTLALDSGIGGTGTITITLYGVPPDSTGNVTIGGGAFTVNITTPGQNGVVTFPVNTANTSVGVHLRNNMFTGECPNVFLFDPSNNQIASAYSVCATCYDFAVQTLASTGTYTVKVDPPSTGTGSVAVNVTSGQGSLCL